MSAPTFDLSVTRRRWGVAITIVEDGEPGVDVRVDASRKLGSRERRKAQVSWSSTSDHRVELAAAYAEALTLAVEIAGELDETGDTKHAPKVDAAREMIGHVLEYARGREAVIEAEKALAILDSPDSTADQIEGVFERWSW